MDLSKLPKPIIYALSIIIVVLGLALAFRIFQGSGISIATPIGDLIIPAGDEQITMNEFIKNSKDVLALANNKIDKQTEIIHNLKSELNRSQKEVKKLTQLTEKLNNARNNQEKQIASRELTATIQAIKSIPLKPIPVPSNTTINNSIKNQIHLYDKIELSQKVRVDKK